MNSSRDDNVLARSGLFVRGTALLAIEHGGDAGPWLERVRRGYTHHSIVMQDASETLAEFAARVREQVEDLEERNMVPHFAVLATGAEHGAQPSQKRSLMLRVLSSSMARAGRGEVMVVPPEGARRDEEALVQAVTEQLAGTDVRMSVDRGEGVSRPLGARWPRSVGTLLPSRKRRVAR